MIKPSSSLHITAGASSPGPFHTVYVMYFKLGFSSMYIVNLQVYKLGFEEVEEPEGKLPTFVRSWRKQGSSRKT